MAPIAPMWWFKEVPVQLETFVDLQHTAKHIVPRPRTLQTQQPHSRTFENQGGVFAFPNQYAKSVVWRTTDNATCLELTSLSGKENTPTRQISFQFSASILPGLHLAPLTQHGGIAISLLTADSVLYRLHVSALSHFLTSDLPEGYVSSAHINWTATPGSDPLSFKYLGDRQAAVTHTDGSLFLVKTALLAEDANRHEHAEVRVYNLHDDSVMMSRTQQVSTIQKLYSRFQTTFDYNLPIGMSIPEHNTSMDVMALETYTTHEDTLLFALYQDRTIRVWSTGRRQCIQTLRTPAALNEAGYVQETIDSSLRAHLGIIFNPLMPWVIRLLAYIPTETDAQLSIFTARIDTTEDVEFLPGSVSTMRPVSTSGPGASTTNLVSMAISPSMNQSGYTVWGLWENDARISAKYLHIDDPVVEREHFQEFAQRDLLQNRWWSVAMQAPPRGFIQTMSSVDDYTEDTPRFFADYVFASGRFSDRTIMQALRSVFKDNTFALDAELPQRVTDALSVKTPEDATPEEKKQGVEDEILGWTMFISTCAKIDHEANAPLGLSIAADTGYMVVVKQSSLSFLTACDDSEIIYHTFQDGQFEVGQLIATPPSQLRSTYPQMQDLALRQDIAKVFKAMDYLTRNISNRVAKTLEGAIAHLTMTKGPRNFVEALTREHLPRYISKSDMNRARNLAASCTTQSRVFDYLVKQLLQNADSSASGLTSKRAILPYEALVAASVQQLATHRYAISQNLLILIAVIFSGPLSTRGWIQDETHFISDAMRVTQSLLVLKWISSQVVSPSASATSGLEQQLLQMHVQEKGTSTSGPVTYRHSLTGSLLKSLDAEIGKYGAVEFPIYLAIPRAVSKLLYQLGVLNCNVDGEGKYYAGLAQRLSGLGEMTLLSTFLEFVPVSTSLSYYRGKVLLSQGKPVEALEQFLAVISCFGNDVRNVEQELDIMQLDYVTRVNRGHAKLEDYYNHIIGLLSEKSAHVQIIKVARLALSDLLGNTKVLVTEAQTRSLLSSIYGSALTIRAYDLAYNAMMQVTSENFRKQYLRLFVSTLCRNGDGGKLSLFPFTGLIEEVERMLLLKAESQHVLSKPDPYKTIYAFYCYRGDYRNAASIMYQYAIRLTDSSNQTESVLALLSEAGNSYLAAINALHLSGPQSTWITIPDKGANAEERAKRRKLSVTTHRHASGMSGVPCKVEVVQLCDMKKEYALNTAKLRLVKEIPAQIADGIAIMREREAQILLVRQGHYDEATSLALLYDLDLDVVFNHLVDRYLAALSNEQEALLGKDGLQQHNSAFADRKKSSVALLTLQTYLDRHDNSSTTFRYRLGVIERILMRNADFAIQPWLTQHYLTHNPEDLIRVYLKFGALKAAAKFSSVVIQAALKKEELISRHSNARWLPYTLLDEIFASLEVQIREAEEERSKKSGGSRRENGKQQSQPSQDKVLKELQEIKGQLEEDVRLYLENAERESVFSKKEHQWGPNV
ncbi:hypothetical protein BGZ70_008276 [Mortierella alpina]|uniref:Uncharacterized protein n=1 Tax=Mortierella alpina TaxID=64518 RepID=A0A9P6J3X5_MORAP|nr:hypothetical protein BGZ70_008276 [Mortierella alpina]